VKGKIYFAIVLVVVIGGLQFFNSHVYNTVRASVYNTVRPLFLNGGGDSCLQDLDHMNVQYTKIDNIGQDRCPVKNAVRIINYPNTKLSAPVILSCPSAKNLALFFTDTGARNVSTFGTYNCKTRRGSSIISEHGYGTAIDISEIDSASVQKDWNKDTKEGETLRNAHQSACKRFSNVLTPDSNADHADHFHLDNGFGFGC